MKTMKGLVRMVAINSRTLEAENERLGHPQQAEVWDFKEVQQ